MSGTIATDFGERALRREMHLLRGAIDLVAGRESQRATVGGLRFGEEVIAAASADATAAGVRLVPISSSDERGADIVVEGPEAADGR